jgi:hypothetical protein
MFDFRDQIPPIYPDWTERRQALEKAKDRLLRAMPAKPAPVLQDDGLLRELAIAWNAVHEALDGLDALRAVLAALTRTVRDEWWDFQIGQLPGGSEPARDEWWYFQIAQLLRVPGRHDPAALRRLFWDAKPFVIKRRWLWVRWRIGELIDAVLDATRPVKSATKRSAGGVPPLDTDGNSLVWMGEVWFVCSEEDGKIRSFLDRPDSAIRHQARLLAEPNRRFPALAFYPPPPDQMPPNAGAVALPGHGRDDASDPTAMGEYKERLERLAQEIKEAKEAHDTDEADRLQAEFDQLAEHVIGEKAGKRGRRKKCGTPSPQEHADQTLRVGLERVKSRFRAKGLPKLADHLDKYVQHAGGEWWYAPPPGTSPWRVTHPDSPPAEN